MHTTGRGKTGGKEGRKGKRRRLGREMKEGKEKGWRRIHGKGQGRGNRNKEEGIKGRWRMDE